MKTIAEQFEELIHNQLFYILVSERYDFNNLLKVATEESFRQGLFSENIFSIPIDVISVFNNFKLNKDFCRQIESNISEENKNGIDQFIFSFFDNTVDTPYQPLFYINCATWIKSTKIKWQLDIDKENLIKFFMVHAVLLERGRIK